MHHAHASYALHAAPRHTLDQRLQHICQVCQQVLDKLRVLCLCLLCLCLFVLPRSLVATSKLLRFLSSLVQCPLQASKPAISSVLCGEPVCRGRQGQSRGHPGTVQGQQTDFPHTLYLCPSARQSELQQTARSCACRKALCIASEVKGGIRRSRTRACDFILALSTTCHRPHLRLSLKRSIP